MVKADLLPDPELVDRFVQVVEDRRAIGDRLRVAPRLELEAQRVHIAVGADTGIAEKVPGAAERRPTLEDRELAVGAHGLQVVGRRNAGDASADDDDVEVLGGDAHHEKPTAASQTDPHSSRRPLRSIRSGAPSSSHGSSCANAEWLARRRGAFGSPASMRPRRPPKPGYRP